MIKTVTKIAVPVFVVAEGSYFLGDPMIALPPQHWPVVLDVSKHFVEPEAGRVLAFPAMGGPGRYLDPDGDSYRTESGFLGLTPERMWAGGLDEYKRQITPRFGMQQLEAEGWGCWVTIARAGGWYCTASPDGVLQFGTITIDTAGPQDDN